MIYFDNAATSRQKPEKVYEAVDFYLRNLGVSPGRGSYQLGISASRMLYQSRTTVGRYFGLTEPDRVVFTKNSTEAINLFFDGFLKQGDHVIISCYEHNAVLRPLQKLKDKGVIDYSVVKREDLNLPAKELLDRYSRDNTRLLAFTLASNLTGRIIFREDLYKCAHDRGLTTFIDSSQGAGKIRLSMKEQGIDFLAFTGHKDLFGIPGCGGLCCESTERYEPLIQGGTGIHGERYVNPDIFPEGYEAGTLNMPAIWALKAGIEYISENQEEITQKDHVLMAALLAGLKKIRRVTLYDADVDRVSTCCFNMKNMRSDKVISYLDEHDVCARGGIHCAILAHEAIGTVETGAVRISLNAFNTEEEVKEFLKIIQSLE